jgi:tetratricopeptide (TPR) repeat protein
MHAFDEMVEQKGPRNVTLITHYIEDSRDFLPLLKLREGLRDLFREYRFPEDGKVRVLSDITSHYSALSELFGFEFDVPEKTLYTKADELIRTGRHNSAREILEYVIEVYPASVNGHWGLASLHREMGDRELALEHYRKCVELMPNMGPAIQCIEKLEAE